MTVAGFCDFDGWIKDGLVQAGCFLLLAVDCLVCCELLKLGWFWCLRLMVFCGLMWWRLLSCKFAWFLASCVAWFVVSFRLAVVFVVLVLFWVWTQVCFAGLFCMVLVPRWFRLV